MIAVHGGIGYQPSREKAQLCANVLESSAIASGDTIDATVIEAVARLEDVPDFNCGYGSNLTRDGTVECEAAFMSSHKSSFGAVSAVSRLRNPIRAAKTLVASRTDFSPQLVAPLVLVGAGAELFAASNGVELLDDTSALISPRARRQHASALKAVAASHSSPSSSSSSDEPLPMDTVGSVSIFPCSSKSEVYEAQAAASSGGIALKLPGRLGPCGVPGAAVWAEGNERTWISVCATGCGEALILTDFSRSLSRELIKGLDEEQAAGEIVDSWFRREFLASRYLEGIEPTRRLAGGLALIAADDHFELVVFHNAPTLPVAFRRAGDSSRVKRFASVLPAGAVLKCDSFLS